MASTALTAGDPDSEDTKAALAAALDADPRTAIDAATVYASRATALPTTVDVQICDKFWKPVSDANGYLSLLAGKPRNAVPSAEVVFKGRDAMGRYVHKCRHELVGVIITVGNLRWAHYVDTASYKLENGLRTRTAKCLGVWDILNYVLVWPNFLLPIQAQIPSDAWFIGNICTVIESLVAEQAFRLQSGLWELVNNVLSLDLDWRTWFGTWLESNGNIFDALHTPIYVVHHNPLFDTSPFVAITGRMETAATLIGKLVRAYGVTVDFELWLPGDPQPDEHANLRVPTYVLRCTDRSSVTGPTKTFLDGILSQAVNFEGSVLGDVLSPWLNPNNEYSGPDGTFIAPAIGVNFMPPWAIVADYGDGTKGPLDSFEIVDHSPQGDTIVLGGKSPKWVDDLMNAIFSWILDSISIIVGFTGIPSDLLDGFLNDAFFAFQLIENFERRQGQGPYGRREKFIPTGAAPYTVDALFSFITAAWDTRGYRSALAVFQNGSPVSVGREVQFGGLMSIIAEGETGEMEMFTDYIENITIRKDRTKAVKVMVQIGDGKAEEAPIVKTQRLLTGIQESLNVVTLSPTS